MIVEHAGFTSKTPLGMLLHRVVAVALTLAQVSAAANLTWSTCSYLTYPTAEDKKTYVAECTAYPALLCHPGICETPDSANATVDAFVKRMAASMRDPSTAPNVWLLQGGPRYAPGSCMSSYYDFSFIFHCSLFLVVFCSMQWISRLYCYSRS